MSIESINMICFYNIASLHLNIPPFSVPFRSQWKLMNLYWLPRESGSGGAPPF